MIEKKIQLTNVVYLLYVTLIVISYNFDPFNLSSDPLIFVKRVHCTPSNSFQNESLEGYYV